MTPERLAEIKAHVEETTPGPWEVHYPQIRSRPHLVALDKDGNISAWLGSATGKGRIDEIDFSFIARARADIPALIAEIERLQARIEELEMHRDTLDASL